MWRRCRTFSNLLLVAGHLFRQGKAIKCLCNQWGKVWNYYSPPCLEPRMFYNSSVWEHMYIPFKANSCSLQSKFVPDRHLQGWALLQSLTLIFCGFFLLWLVGVFFPIRKEIELVLKSYHVKWFSAPFSSSVITYAAPLPPRKRLRGNLALGRLNTIWW